MTQVDLVPVEMKDSRPFLEPKGYYPIHIGKVRDTYDVGKGLLLVVATDRISTFDVVHPNVVPGKGTVLTAMTVFWLGSSLAMVCPNHFVDLVPSDGSIFTSKGLVKCPEVFGRAMLVRKANPFPVECIVRGYLAGSAWVEYKQQGTVCGLSIPAGMVESQKLEYPIFTPTTKANIGHDQNLSWEAFVAAVGGREQAKYLKSTSLSLYDAAFDYAKSRGIIIADTKFEFGIDNDTGEILLIDEVLTPDSSRFWDISDYKSGRGQRAMDKQLVRDWGIASGWNREPPAPPLPEDVIKGTVQQYGLIQTRLLARS